MAISSVGYTPLTPSEVLANIQAVFVNAFGSEFNLDPAGVNGVLIQTLADMSIQVENAKALLYDGLYNPDVANGIWLRSIGKFNNLNAKDAVPSVVTCEITGSAGVVIPINSQVISTNNDIFVNPNLITIGVGGTATATFESVNTGAVPCGANSINRIVSAIPGWDTINNATAGIIGTNNETDNNLRNRRVVSLAINSVNTVNSILSRLAQIEDVIDYYIIENRSSTSTKTERGVTVNTNSIYLSVFGGSDQEIAQVLYEGGNPAGMDGNTTVAYTDPKYPWITENMTFQRAIDQPIAMVISITNSAQYPANIVDLIKQSVKDNWDGKEGQLPVTMSSMPVYASRFYSSLIALGVTNIISFTIGIVSGSQGAFINLPITDSASLDIINITVNVV